MQDTKSRILSEAETLFGKKGIRETSIDDICHQVGISKRTFYQYYRQKEDLIADFISIGMDKIQQDLDSFISQREPVEILLSLSSQAAKKVLFNPPPAFVEEIKKYYYQIFVKASKDRSRFVKDSLLDFLQKGIDSGQFRSDLDVPAVLKMLMLSHKGVSDYYYKDDYLRSGKKISMKAMASAYGDMVNHLLLSPAGWEKYDSLKCDQADGQ